MTTPPPLDRDKLAKICGMLSSDKSGEVVNAAKKATEMLYASKTTWYELIMGTGQHAQQRAYQQPHTPPPPQRDAGGTADARGDLRWDKFSKRFPEEAQWIEEERDTFDFAESLYHGARKFGSLTEKQMAAVHRGIARKKARDEEEEGAHDRGEPSPRSRSKANSDDEPF